jgi:hypothetical protein
MAKITKHAEFMEKLHTMITKEGAGTAHTTGAAPVTGKPGADTEYQSVSKETEHVDKNKEGHPEHNPQEFKQEKAHDASDPTKKHHAKSAEEIAKEASVPDTKAPATAKIEAPTTVSQTEGKKIASEAPTNEKLAQLGEQLLAAINEMQKTATGTAKTTGAATVTGKPNGDVQAVSVSKETEHVDKNKEGHPEHNPQEFKQEKAKDPADPTKKHHSKSAEEVELDKEASFELGRQFARSFLQSKTASVEDPIYKEAGRRDFEALIAQAEAELSREATPVTPVTPVVKQAEIEVEDDSIQIKQAEEAGAQAFHTLLKQAQDEEAANQFKLAFEQKLAEVEQAKFVAEKKANELSAKVASFEAEKEKAAEDAKLDTKLAQWGRYIVDDVITRLKAEPSK